MFSKGGEKKKGTVKKNNKKIKENRKKWDK